METKYQIFIFFFSLQNEVSDEEDCKNSNFSNIYPLGILKDNKIGQKLKCIYPVGTTYGISG